VQRNPLADAAALHAIRLVSAHLPAALARPDDLVARGQLLLAAHLGGIAFNSSGVGLTHAMAHVTGARHDVHHGTANAILLPHVMRFDADELGPQLAAVAGALGLPPGADAAAAADAVGRLVARSGLPTRLRDVKVPEAALPALAEAALSDGAIVFNGKFAADRDLVLGVFRQAW
jgi:alcohol dehydrogenase